MQDLRNLIIRGIRESVLQDQDLNKPSVYTRKRSRACEIPRKPKDHMRKCLGLDAVEPSGQRI